MRIGFGLVLAAFAALAITSLSAQAQVKIELTKVDPPAGAVDAPPEVVSVCFSEPVNIDDTSTWRFGYKMPDGKFLGLRTEFKTDGTCAGVYPGLPQELPAGEYTFEWRVTAAEGGGEGSGTLLYEVTSASSSGSPTSSPDASATPAPTASPAERSGGDDGSDTLLIVLLAAAVVGGVLVLLTIAYLLRRRGRQPPTPPTP